MPVDSEALLLNKFEKLFTHFHNPHKEYRSNRLFQSDLKETLKKNAAYTAKPTLQGLLTATKLVMNSWKKDAFRQRQRAELGVDTKRKGSSTSTISTKRTRADAPSIPDKATVGADAPAILVTSQDGTPRAVGSTPRLTKPRTPSISLIAMGPDTWCYGDTHPRLHPSLATPPSRTPSTAPPAGIASSSDNVDKHHIGHGGNNLPAYSLLHITCNCDDTDVDTMYRTCCTTTGTVQLHSPLLLCSTPG